MTDRTLSALIHGESKVGKTTLTSTLPLPMCVLDAEGGWRFIREAGHKSGVKLRQTTWNPQAGPPPTYDGTWDVCRVSVFQWSDLTQAYMWLNQSQHSFKSLVVDSVTEAQRKCKANLRGMDQMRIQDWGDLLMHMDKLIRDFRDLILRRENALEVAVFIAETEMKDGKWRPAMQGQIGRAMPYWVDLCGYLYRAPKMKADNSGPELNANGQPEMGLHLLVGQGVQPAIIAGERVQGALGDIVPSPNFTTMLNEIFGEEETNTV